MTDRNVVMLTFDSLRADHCGYVGYERETTPAIDRLAAEGVACENAIAPASRTNPSMAGALTGTPMVVRDAVRHPEHSRSHLARHGTLAEAMRDRGYATGAFCPNAYASSYYGFDRGFDAFEDFLFDNETYRALFENHLGDSRLSTTLRNLRNYVRKQEAFKTWDTYVDEIEAWVEDQEDPFFLWAFSLDTHFPYVTPREYRRWSSLFDGYYYNWTANRLIDDVDPDVSERTLRKLVDVYDDSIRFADAFVRELRERLAEYDPVFVVYGDHGEAFCERDVYGHFYPSLYEENVHVPLVVAGDGVPDATVTRPVSLTDVPDLVRAATDPASDDARETLTTGRDWVVATDYDGRNDRDLLAVRTRDGKYLRTVAGGTERNELYDLAADPGERRDRTAEDPPFHAPLRALADRRAAHEDELLAVRAAASSIDDRHRGGERAERAEAPP